MFRSLQAGRAVAALLVVLFHLNTTIFGAGGYWPQSIWSGLDAGHSGVHFFFVLSGFIIMWVHRDQIGDASKAREFVSKRLLRIYPVYWIVLLCVVPLYFLVPGSGEGYETHPYSIITSFALWPTPEKPILAVAWTLRHEMMFYAFFGILIVWPRIGLSAMGLWLLGCIVALAWPMKFPLQFVFHSLNLLFPMGMLAALISRERKLPRPWVWATLLVAFCHLWASHGSTCQL